MAARVSTSQNFCPDQPGLFLLPEEKEKNKKGMPMPTNQFDVKVLVENRVFAIPEGSLLKPALFDVKTQVQRNRPYFERKAPDLVKIADAHHLYTYSSLDGSADSREYVITQAGEAIIRRPGKQAVEVYIEPEPEDCCIIL